MVILSLTLSLFLSHSLSLSPPLSISLPPSPFYMFYTSPAPKCQTPVQWKNNQIVDCGNISEENLHIFLIPTCVGLGIPFVPILRSVPQLFFSVQFSWFKRGLFTWLYSSFKTEYNKLRNKPNGLYVHSSNIRHTKLQTEVLKTTRRTVMNIK